MLIHQFIIRLGNNETKRTETLKLEMEQKLFKVVKKQLFSK